MNPRKLDKLIHVLRAREVQDASGQDVPVEWPRLHRKVPAEVEEVTGGKTTRGRQVEASVTSTVMIRFLRDLTTADRIEYGERVLSIVRALDPDQTQTWMELHCSDAVD